MEKELKASEIAQRLLKLQRKLQEKNLDGCLITSNVNLYYYAGTVQAAYLFLPREGEPILFTRKNYRQARAQSPLKEICLIKKPEEIKELLTEVGIKPAQLGLELATLPVKDYQRLVQIFSGIEVHDISNLIREQRAVKSPYELQQLKATGAKAAVVFEAFPRLIKAGMLDYELAAAVEYEFRKAGHIGLIRNYGANQDFFFGQVLVGDNALEPPAYDLALGGQGLSRAFPLGTSGKALKPGQTILIDYVANFYGYNVDISRTYSLGSLPAEQNKAYQVAQEIQEKIAMTAKPGVSCAALYDLALKTVKNYNLEQYFMGYEEQAKFVGHGLGLELNELPVLAAKFKVELQAGMVIALEPKFVFPHIGAVGLENTFVVGEHGLEKITPIKEEIFAV